MAATTGGGIANHMAVMGSLSLICWALILVVTIKYVLIILRADNDGEGGTLALRRWRTARPDFPAAPKA